MSPHTTRKDSLSTFLTGPAVSHFAEQLQDLAAISQEFSTSLDISETLNHAVLEIMDYLDAEAASIFLLNDKSSGLTCKASSGPIDITGLTIDSDQGIVGKAIKENTVQMIRDTSSIHEFTGHVDNITGFKTRSILCAPLSIKDNPIGAIEILNKKSDDGLFNLVDLYLVQVLASSAALAINNARMAATLVGQERLKKELELAGEIQRSLLPQSSHADFPITAVNIPARIVSGDFYDFFTLDDGRIFFNVGDVSGKGINAALLMAKTSSLFHCLGKTIHSPGQLLSIINNEICETSMRGMFVTMLGGIYNPHTHEVIYSNAGHLPPLYSASSGVYSILETHAPPLGIIPGQHYSESTIRLDDGCLYVFTDGLTEASDIAGKQIGYEGLQTLISDVSIESPDKRLHSLISRILTGHAELHDDVTVLLLKDIA